MKTPIKKTLIVFLAALMMTGFAACGKESAATAMTPFPERKTEAEEASAGEKADTVEKAEAKAPAGAFKETTLIKIGEHTYYPEGLFDQSDRDRDYKEHMISRLTQADKDIHDDIYVHGIGESEVKGEFRFFGLMMNDGVTYDCAYMTCWYDGEKGSFWSNDSKFRRSDFNKSGLINAQDAFGKVYEKASKSDKVKEVNSKVTGTYLLMCDSKGTLYYRFTVNKFSTVDVDAKTGEIISERYWNGDYT
jgi:hypothetical protein